MNIYDNFKRYLDNVVTTIRKLLRIPEYFSNPALTKLREKTGINLTANDASSIFSALIAAISTSNATQAWTPPWLQLLVAESSVLCGAMSEQYAHDSRMAVLAKNQLDFISSIDKMRGPFIKQISVCRESGGVFEKIPLKSGASLVDLWKDSYQMNITLPNNQVLILCNMENIDDGYKLRSNAAALTSFAVAITALALNIVTYMQPYIQGIIANLTAVNYQAFADELNKFLNTNEFTAEKAREILKTTMQANINASSQNYELQVACIVIAILSGSLLRSLYDWGSKTHRLHEATISSAHIEILDEFKKRLDNAIVESKRSGNLTKLDFSDISPELLTVDPKVYTERPELDPNVLHQEYQIEQAKIERFIQGRQEQSYNDAEQKLQSELDAMLLRCHDLESYIGHLGSYYKTTLNLNVDLFDVIENVKSENDMIISQMGKISEKLGTATKNITKLGEEKKELESRLEAACEQIEECKTLITIGGEIDRQDIYKTTNPADEEELLLEAMLNAPDSPLQDNALSPRLSVTGSPLVSTSPISGKITANPKSVDTPIESVQDTAAHTPVTPHKRRINLI